MKKVYMYNNSSTFPRLVFASDSFEDFEGILILAGVLNIEIEKITYDNMYGFKALTAISSYSDCYKFTTAAQLIGWKGGPEYGDVIWNPSIKVNYTISTNDSRLYVTATKFADLAYACWLFEKKGINIVRVDTTNDPNSHDPMTYTLVSATIPDMDILKTTWRDLLCGNKEAK